MSGDHRSFTQMLLLKLAPVVRNLLKEIQDGIDGILIRPQDVAKPHEVKDGRASSHGNQAEKKQAEDTSKEKPGRLSCSMLGHLEG
jgi:hypothetical protein